MNTSLIHNRPSENDCYDAFAADLCSRRSDEYAYRRWSDADALHADRIVCCMQDPVPLGSRRMRVFEDALSDKKHVLNHPRSMNHADRTYAYPLWHELGFPVPCRTPWVNLCDVKLPFIAKDNTRHMGKAFLIDSEERIDWLKYSCDAYINCSEKFVFVPFKPHRTHWGDYEMQRYMVLGDDVVPLVLSWTRGWISKASKMKQGIKRWADDKRHHYCVALQKFWQDEPPVELADAVRALDIDFALVDAVVNDGTVQMIWECNPYMNLSGNYILGKEQLWWRAFENYLTGENMSYDHPEPQAFLQQIEAAQGHSHWSKR